jgi:hypothetical protein
MCFKTTVIFKGNKSQLINKTEYDRLHFKLQIKFQFLNSHQLHCVHTMFLRRRIIYQFLVLESFIFKNK